MWEEIFLELKKVNIDNLPYDHPLCSGILDTSSEPFVNQSMSESTRNTFQKPIEKYNIDENKPLKDICKKFVQDEKLSYQKKLFSGRFDIQDVNFGEFIDTSANLRQMTDDMLEVL
jgi:hypothetical protein